MNLIDLDIIDSERVEQDSPVIHITIDGEEIEAIRLDYLYSLSKGPKTGHWIFVDKTEERAYCSECYYGDVDLFNGRPHNYCENCGAKMQEVEK